MKLNWLTLLLLFATMLSAGCDSGGNGAASSNGSSSEQEQGEEEADGEIKRRTLASLPAVDSYLPPQDSGRVHIAPPQGWRPVSRDKYLVRFVKGEPSELPRIAVAAADSPSPEVTNVTEENFEELLPVLTVQSKEGKKTPIEPVRPIILGDHLFARHVRLARYNDAPCAIVSLQTVQDGRMYTVELYVKAGSDGSEYATYLKQSQDDAYAVAANMKFGDQPEAAPMPSPSEEKPAEEDPAES